MKKIILASFGIITFILGFIAGSHSVALPSSHITVVAKNDDYTLTVNPLVLEHAKSWCEQQIANGNLQGGYFKYAIRDIDSCNIRWSINDPNGLHYKMLFDFAGAWEKQIAKKQG